MVQPNTIISLAMLHPDPPDDLRRAISGATFSFETDKLSEHEEKAIREFKTAARKCLQELSEQTMKALCSTAESIFAATQQLTDIERNHDDAMEDCFQFWEAVSKESIGKCRFTEMYDLQAASWLGNGKWGWVMMSKERASNRKVVVKISDIKHAAESVKEWKYGTELCARDTIVDYHSAFLFADTERLMRTKLMKGYSDGKLKGTGKRNFPDTFVCMVEELMNCGTVQHWIDESLLKPTGMLVVMQQVADALAYMHDKGVTHNDMKPENILLHHEGKHIFVRLGDLGLAEKSDNRTSDITRFGMTSLCMATGEQFGTRRFKPESIDEFVADIEACSKDCGAEGRLGSSLAKLPALLRAIFQERKSMQQVRDDESLRGWEFLEEGSAHNYHRTKSSPDLDGIIAEKQEEQEAPTRSRPSFQRTATESFSDHRKTRTSVASLSTTAAELGGKQEQLQEAAIRRHFNGYS